MSTLRLVVNGLNLNFLPLYLFSITARKPAPDGRFQPSRLWRQDSVQIPARRIEPAQQPAVVEQPPGDEKRDPALALDHALHADQV